MSPEFIEADYPPLFSEFVCHSHYVIDDLLAGLKNKAVDSIALEESLVMLKQLVDCMDVMHNETQGAGTE
jgi:hypothetical protein